MENNIFIIVGHYGSGKTEFAVNFAYRKKAEGHDVAIADLDVVNPFFRSRQKKPQLNRDGIDVLSSNFENDPYIDLPSVAAGIQSFFEVSERCNIVDVGGDAVGARTLGRYSRRLENVPYEMWMVVNANRYFTQSATEAIEYIRAIEATSRLKVTGLVNNTHYLRETDTVDLLKGDEVVREISAQLGIPVRYVSYIKSLEEKAKALDLAGEHLPIDMQMRDRWY